MVCRTANVTSPAVATSITATTWPLLLLALIVVLGMSGGVGLVLSGAACASAAASQSLAGASRAFELKIMGVKWGNESWTPRPDGFDVGTTSASAALPRCSPAGSERLTTARGCSGWSRPLLPDHAELAASEQAERDAARARRGGKPIRRVLSARFDKMSHRRRRPADSIVSPPPAPRQPIMDLLLLPRNASADQPPLAYIFSLPSLAKKEAPEVVADQAVPWDWNLEVDQSAVNSMI